MELVGQQWAGSFSGARGMPAAAAGSLSKVEIFTDPGTYNGSKAKFEDWWTKMKVWLNYNLKQFSYIDADRDKIINGKNCAYAILSCLQDPKGSHFVEVELQKLANRGTQLQNWKTLIKKWRVCSVPNYRLIKPRTRSPNLTKRTSTLIHSSQNGSHFTISPRLMQLWVFGCLKTRSPLYPLQTLLKKHLKSYCQWNIDRNKENHQSFQSLCSFLAWLSRRAIQ